MRNIEKKHFDAAGAMAEVFAVRLGKDRAVHSETVISAAARMAGTMLFRSFGFDTSKMEPGSVVLSNEANEKGPELMSIVMTMMHEYGLELDQEKLSVADDRGADPQLSVLEMQDLLESDLMNVIRQYNLTLEDGAYACALTAAWLISECAPQIGAEVGFNMAAYGFIEGSKTVPRSLDTTTPGGAKRPWYHLWK